MPIRDRSVSRRRFILIVLLATLTVSCASIFKGKDEAVQAKNLYFRAKSALQQRHYADALEKYAQLETSFPFSPYAKNAAIEQAYAHYKSHQYEETIVILDRLIQLNPNHPRIDYIYYLKGLAYYNYGEGFFSRILKRDRTNKDATLLIEAFAAFKHLHQNYPDSIYNGDAWLRIITLRNLLAVHEIRIADYYLRRRAYLATINRCKYALEHYPNAQHTPEALVLLAEAYRRTDSPELAQDTLRVLELNYPGFVKKAGKFGQVSDDDRRNWVENLKDLADTILESLRFKSRY